MPSHRRPTPVVAADLPASRLPVGTPTLIPEVAASQTTSSARPRSEASNHSARHHHQRSPRLGNDSHSPPPVSPQSYMEMSIAESKLDRQRKRNEAAEASLTAPMPPPVEKRQASRTKGKWKPFDYASEAGGGVPVETRINMYSRASSASRPISALSHRTDESVISDSSGFQVFTGRKARRHPIELRQIASDKPQTTVEASFDKREIYEVFGNALPGPEYLEQNAGFKDGQVQFLQHPNGDVSAQQWSASRFEWANLGQFSNIRKKVEGQLASDRLKGEMAHHTLQQNTLQYFRTIAKQREALAMGLPFGPKDVEAALPMPTTAHISQPAKESRVAIPNFTKDTENSTETQTQEFTRVQPTVPAAVAPRSPLPPNVPRKPMAQRWEVTGDTGGAYAWDPFYQVASAMYSAPTQGATPSYTTAMGTSYGYPNMAQTPYRGAHSYQFPPVVVPNQTLQSPGAQKYFADRAAIADRMQSQLRQVYGGQTSMLPYPQPYYYNQNIPDAQLAKDVGTYQTANDREIVAPQPKSISSVDRSAMRQTLYKLGETAKERNLSQTNIRTVLHDPFQSPPEADQQEAKSAAAASKEVESPLNAKAAASKKPVTQSSPLPAVRDQRRYILEGSSPDTQWIKRPYEHSTPLLSQSSTSKATSQAVHGVAVDVKEQSKKSEAVHAPTTYEEHLNDWWWNGSTFARQQDLYHAITATQAADIKLTSPPAHLTLIGRPSQSHTDIKPNFNKTTTRVLIPVYENLASYVDGPKEKRRDYWCPWGPAPEWCIDRAPDGNKSFFDADWGSPPQRVGRDPRYSSSRDGGGAASTGRASGWLGVDPRFAHAGRF